MRLGCPGGDPEPGSDLVVGAAGRDQGHDLTLTIRNGRVGFLRGHVDHRPARYSLDRGTTIRRGVYLAVYSAEDTRAGRLCTWPGNPSASRRLLRSAVRP